MNENGKPQYIYSLRFDYEFIIYDFLLRIDYKFLMNYRTKHL